MQRAHAYVARLVLWSARPEIQERYPRACSAIANLRDEWGAETPQVYRARIKNRYRRRFASASQQRPTAKVFDPIQAVEAYNRESDKFRQRNFRIRREVKRLRAQVANFKTTKTLGGRLSHEWILRVILSAPNASGRGLVDAFKMAVASDSSVISRASLGCIKAAFLGLWKEINHKVIRGFLSAQFRGSCQRLPAASLRPRLFWA